MRFFFARTKRAREIFDARNRSFFVSLVSRVNVSLSDLNFERDLVRFQRGGKEGGKGKGRGEKRGERAKRNDETRKGVRVFDRSQRSGKRSRREGDSGTVIDLRSTQTVVPFHQKKDNVFERRFAKLKGSFFFLALSLSLSLSPSRFPLSRAEEDATDGLSSPSPVFIRRFRVAY